MKSNYYCHVTHMNVAAIPVNVTEFSFNQDYFQEHYYLNHLSQWNKKQLTPHENLYFLEQVKYLFISALYLRAFRQSPQTLKFTLGQLCHV